MRLRKIVLTFGLMAALTAPALAQVKFERKIQEGSKKTSEVTTRVEQKLTVGGTDVDTESDTRMTVQTTSGKRDDSGNIRVQEKVINLMIMSKLQGTEYVFDSSNPDKTTSSPLEMLRPVHKIVAGRTTTTVFDKDNKIAQVEFDNNQLNDLAENVRNLVKDEFDAEKIKKTANEEIDRLPAEPVKKGDAWERMHKRNLGGGQMLTTTTRYTYEGEIEKDGKKFDKINSKILSVDLTVEDPQAQVMIKSSDLKPAESKGELLYDRKLGTVVSGSSSVRIVGDITLVINGMELPAKLDLKMESSSQPKE